MALGTKEDGRTYSISYLSIVKRLYGPNFLVRSSKVWTIKSTSRTLKHKESIKNNS